MEELITLALKTAIVLTVFTLGLRASTEDARYLFGRPWLLFKSMVSMNVVMPLFAAAMVAVFQLHPAVEIALITLSVSPIPPMISKKLLKAGGEASYAIGLLVAASLFAMVFVPLAVGLMGRAFGRPATVSTGAVALIVAITVLAPLTAGTLVRRLAPVFARRIAKPVSLGAMAILVLSLLPILFKAMPVVLSLIGNGTLAAILAFIVAGLVVGHLLGGPQPADRPVLALMTSSRHPGVAIAIAHASFPQQKAAVAAILLYLLVNVLVSILYLTWCKRRRTEFAARSQSRHWELIR